MEICQPVSLEASRAGAVEAASIGWWAAAKTWLLPGVLVGAFVVLALAYSVRVPLYEAPDELDHVRYVETLAHELRLPEPSETHQVQHPPLYYALEAAVVRVLGLPKAAQQPGDTDLTDAAVFAHPDEAFPWRKEVAAMQVMRGVTVLFGAGVVILTYLIAQLLFPQRRWLSLAAASTTALLPQFAFIGGVVNNDVPAAFFASLAVYAGLRFMKTGTDPWLLASAVAVGLAALTKSSAAASGIVPLGAIFLTPAGSQQRWRRLAFVCAIPAAIAGWYYIRSIVLWGNVFASDEFTIPQNPRGLTDPLYRTAFFSQLFDSYWYKGGWMNIAFSSLVYQALYFFPVFALAGLIVALRRPVLDGFQRRAVWLLMAVPIVSFLGVVEFSVVQDWGPQGRYMFPAQSAIALLLALGVSSVFSRDETDDHPAMFVLPAFLLFMNVWIFAVKLPAGYG